MAMSGLDNPTLLWYVLYIDSWITYAITKFNNYLICATTPPQVLHELKGKEYEILCKTLLTLVLLISISVSTALLSMFYYVSYVGIITGTMVPLFLLLAIHHADASNTFHCFILLCLFSAFTGYTLCPLLILNIHMPVSMVEITFLELIILFSIITAILVVVGQDETKNFTQLNPLLFKCSIVCVIIPIINIMILHIPILSLCIACSLIVLHTLLYISEISSIIRGSQPSYMLAALSLYMRLLDIFIPLFSIKLGLYGSIYGILSSFDVRSLSRNNLNTVHAVVSQCNSVGHKSKKISQKPHGIGYFL